ncbi:hypothetical protein K435DRAFT_866832 [Dendrothele bispora CBS 962.96]|uniref:Uncharacterized protein n=1 Tax=Dendrothele bispora (strain CBS 962.96) TaxID=1314807 RepID=A0A4S8LFW1_DENBC|nr:hypothetical protein K435DRAFT_866832 [Dendrothele bispora CBS 962.96]
MIRELGYRNNSTRDHRTRQLFSSPLVHMVVCFQPDENSNIDACLIDATGGGSRPILLADG